MSLWISEIESRYPSRSSDDPQMPAFPVQKAHHAAKFVHGKEKEMGYACTRTEEANPMSDQEVIDVNTEHNEKRVLMCES